MYVAHNSVPVGVTVFLTLLAAVAIAVTVSRCQVCHVESEVVANYKTFLSSHADVSACPQKNKLRDIDVSYIDQGHCFIISKR